MKVPFIDLIPQYRSLRAALAGAARRVFETERFVLGEEGEKLERDVCRYTKARFAVALNSGSDALYLSLLALGAGHGDEVITTPFTFFATAGAISRTGARPVFVDIDQATFNLDPACLPKTPGRRIKAVIPVHLFGLASDMTTILLWARKHNVAVIEDAAQAFGADYKGRKAGALGGAGCFSFYPTKNLGGAGDGGMVITSSRKLAAQLRLLRDHGQIKKYRHAIVGTNSRLDEIQAAVLRVKLRRLDHWNQKRRAIAARYDRAFRNLPLQTPAVPRGTKHVYHLYSILTPERDMLASHLSKRGIGNGVYYPLPLHLQPCYRALGYKKGDFPVAERVSRRVLSLPLYPELSKAAQDAVIEGVRSFFDD